MEHLPIALILIGSVIFLLVIFQLLRRPPGDFSRLIGEFQNLQKNQERAERMIKEEIAKNREESANAARRDREELTTQSKAFSDSILKELLSLTNINEQKLEQMRGTIEQRLKVLQDENSQKLEKMREVVDEKLHATLEKRLGESFKLVSDRLEQVYKGLGEMHNLAAGVGDLKKVLANVKTRGAWGEVQLGNLLEQVLTRDQYETNVVTKKDSSDRVEFAIKLPGRDENTGVVWLPIDAKFPLEDYQRLLDAQERGDISEIKRLEDCLGTVIKNQAKKIRDKYIDPPYTTDFAIMFLPVEGLYAEALRRSGLCELLQREYRIVPTGPTTITALLNSLQMGFRTLAIEKRASEVWQILGAVKTDFSKFGDILDKTKKKLEEASNSIEDASKKSRYIERKLRDVQKLPAQETPLKKLS